jgi:serine/threonine protein kinase
MGQIQECRGDLRTRSGDDVDLLDLLERKNFLTSLQVERIRKGDAEGLVLGGFKLMYRIASGSFARVYRACSVQDDRTVAIKVLRERWSSDPDTLMLFRREGEVGQRLKHPHIVPIFDVASEGNIHYITMEFVEGGNLRDFLKIRGRLTPAETMRYAIQMAEGLGYALGMGITHRDLKLTNVLMSSRGTVKLIDFGLATDDRVLSKLGDASFAQALEYSTLERHTGTPRNDPRSDLYFLGGILYELLSGQPPFPRTRSRDERKDIMRYRQVKPLRTLAPNVPDEVARIVDRLMCIEPVERYQSPAQVIGDMRPVLARFDDNSTTQSSSIVTSAMNGTAATVLCVEDRKKHQDWLREYLSRHNFRVLLLSDAERALQRMRTSPPDCVIFMGGALGDQLIDSVNRAVQLGRAASVVTVVVLSERQEPLADQILRPSELVRVLQQPIQLRDLRTAINEGLQARRRL